MEFTCAICPAHTIFLITLTSHKSTYEYYEALTFHPEDGSSMILQNLGTHAADTKM
jgi:hypothetical protein